MNKGDGKQLKLRLLDLIKKYRKSSIAIVAMLFLVTIVSITNYYTEQSTIEIRCQKYAKYSPSKESYFRLTGSVNFRGRPTKDMFGKKLYDSNEGWEDQNLGKVVWYKTKKESIEACKKDKVYHFKF